MALIDLIQADLRDEDKAILSKIDLGKSNAEIIKDLTEAKLLKFIENDYENQKTEQNQ